MYSLFGGLGPESWIEFYPHRTLTQSGKVIPLTDSILLTPTKEFLMYISAIIIQAYWRGFQVRNQAWYDKEGEKWFIWYENSATKRIQRIWRGRQGRISTELKKMNTEWQLRCGGCKECCAAIAFEQWNKEIDDLIREDLNNKILIIQKYWRGYKSRKVNTKPAIYSVLHIEDDQVWIIDQEGVFLKKTPSPSELPKPPEKWLIEQERFKRLLYESFDEFEREQDVAFAHEYQ